ncbi:MAG: DUF5522 domain-containing protein [Sediminibacterium sp.]|jgi:hypothetical protein
MPVDQQYYIDVDGKWVFTEAYHKERGYCCGNACRHCPYEYEAVPEPVKTRLMLLKEFNQVKNSNAIHGKDE